MMIIKAFVNYDQIDEIWIHNTGPLRDGFYGYQIEKPEIYHSPIIHNRSDGWKSLAEKVFGILNDERWQKNRGNRK